MPHFFGTKEDLLPVFELVESKSRLRYVLTGNFLERELAGGVKVFESGTQLPNLGRATAECGSSCDSFLVCEAETAINLRCFQGNDGNRVCIDQLVNPDTVVFNPGGMWGEDVLLNGRVATVSNSPVAQALMRRFRGAIRKTFKNIRAFYVGPAALAMLASGKRLTGAIQSPPEFDLLPPDTGSES
jgi:hypothetical protein